MRTVLCTTLTQYSTLVGQMGGTIGFVDNNPYGTIMTLRIPQQQQQQRKAPLKSLTSTSPTSVAAAAVSTGQTGAATATANTDVVAGGSTERSSKPQLPRMLQVSLDALSAEHERVVRSKRILVSSVSVASHCC
jgi:hypothetical protein